MTVGKAGPPEFNCWTSVAPAFQTWFAVEYMYLSCFISVMNLDLYVRCFDSLMSRSFTRTEQLLCVYEPQQNLGRGRCNVKSV